jgi:hypothetical protein
MEDFEARILCYPDLAPPQQEAVAERASEHPERAALLAHVNALERLFEHARALRSLPDASGEDASDDAAGEEALAFFLATPREALPPALQRDFDRVAEALDDAERGSALHERCAALSRRLRALEEQSADAQTHFENLTGHALDGPSHADGYAPPDDADAPGRVEEPSRSPAAEAPGREADRDAKRRATSTRFWRPAAWPKAVRYAAAAVLAVLVLYGALRVASRLSQSQMERLASVEEEQLRVEGYTSGNLRLRGGGASSGAATVDSASLDQRYLRGLRSLRAARTSTLGLFPRYDEAALRRAERRLEAVAEETEAGSFLHLEALFFLGKARLALGDKAGATRALRRVAAGGGRLTPEAQDLLETLYEDAAYDGPPAPTDA